MANTPKLDTQQARLGDLVCWEIGDGTPPVMIAIGEVVYEHGSTVVVQEPEMGYIPSMKAIVPRGNARVIVSSKEREAK